MPLAEIVLAMTGVFFFLVKHRRFLTARTLDLHGKTYSSAGE
jgi:hypothetical protein